MKRGASIADHFVTNDDTDECVIAFADLLETSEIFLAPLWTVVSKPGN
jgi:hypothetical protein